MSIRKSNWSDLLSALAMSARDSVRRLFESAMMNARAVTSEMKTVIHEHSILTNNTLSPTLTGLAEQYRRWKK